MAEGVDLLNRLELKQVLFTECNSSLVFFFSSIVLLLFFFTFFLFIQVIEVVDHKMSILETVALARLPLLSLFFLDMQAVMVCLHFLSPLLLFIPITIDLSYEIRVNVGIFYLRFGGLSAILIFLIELCDRHTGDHHDCVGRKAVLEGNDEHLGELWTERQLREK